MSNCGVSETPASQAGKDLYKSLVGEKIPNKMKCAICNTVLGWIMVTSAIALGLGLSYGRTSEDSAPAAATATTNGTAPVTTGSTGTDSDKIVLVHDVVIGTGGGRELHAEIAYPKVLPKEPMPVMLQIHGGGWRSGSPKRSLSYKVLAEHGYFGASIEYRLTNEARWPAQIEDCKLAVRWIRANAEKYHINLDAIGCTGGSAGGHLVDCLATLDDPGLEGNGGYAGVSSKVQAVVDVNGPTDLIKLSKSNPMALFGVTSDQNPDLYRQASPYFHVKPGLPPFLIIHGDKDESVPLEQSLMFMEALKKANVPVEILVVKGAGHAVNVLRPDIMETILNFCDKHLRK